MIERFGFLEEFHDLKLEMYSKSLGIPWGNQDLWRAVSPQYPKYRCLQVIFQVLEASAGNQTTFLLSHHTKIQELNGVSNKTEGMILLVYYYQEGSILGPANTGSYFFSDLRLP